MSSFQPISPATSNMPLSVPLAIVQSHQQHNLDDLCVANPMTPERFDHLRDALYCLPVEFCDQRDQWLRILAALHTEAGQNPDYADRLLALADEWSRLSVTKYKPGDAQTMWDSFGGGYTGKPATLGTIYHLAKQHGFTFSTQAVNSLSPDSADDIPATRIDEIRSRFAVRSYAECIAQGHVEVDYAIDGLLAAGLDGCLSAVEKTGKTSIMADWAASLAGGVDGQTYALGHFSVRQPGRVLVFDGEPNRRYVTQAQKIIQSRGVNEYALGHNLIICEYMPQIDSKSDMEAVSDLIAHYHPAYIVLDPIYKCWPGDDPYNFSKQGRYLRLLSDFCRKRGVTLLCTHHCRKPRNYVPWPDLTELNGSGWGAHFRTHYLLNRTNPFDERTGTHKLHFRIQSQAPLAHKYALTIIEGADFSRWDVTVTDYTQGESETVDYRSRVLECIRLTRASAKVLRKIAHTEYDIPYSEFDLIWAGLIDSGKVKPAKDGRKTIYVLEGDTCTQ